MLTITIGFAAQAWMDDFEDGKLDGWMPNPQGGVWEIKKGELHYDGSGGCDSVLYTGSMDWTDYELEVDIKLTVQEDFPGGLRYRLNPKNGASYMSWVYPSQTMVSVLYGVSSWDCNSGVAGPVFFNPWKPPKPDEFHKLKVAVTGNNIEVYWDGEQISSEKDGTYKNGCIGLSGFNKPVIFDNVLVTGPGIPHSPGEPGAVSPAAKLTTIWATLKQ